MFASYPGFEDLSLRVEVEWLGQKRMVVARFEQWPYWGATVLVCTFEDAATEGEWMLFSGRSLRNFRKPEQMIQSYELSHGESSEPHPKMEFVESELEQLHQMIRGAFSNPRKTSVVRLLSLPELPAEPRLALQTEAGLYWCSDGRDPNFVPFKMNFAPCKMPVDASESEASLRRAWNNRSSDAHFTWKWAMQSDSERFKTVTGFAGSWDWRAIEQVMKWVLTSASALWQLDGGWLWQISADAQHDILEDRSYGNSDPGSILDEWIAFLRAYYVPRWRDSLVIHHQCVHDFCGTHGCNIGLVQMVEPPTAHEQLEAKLALREWLADAATPAVATALLASLDD